MPDWRPPLFRLAFCQALTTDNLVAAFQMWDTIHWRKVVVLLFVKPAQFVVRVKAPR
jgi:hypothetical protein